MKILVDMNLSPGWVDRPTAAGFEAVHWANVGSGGELDQVLMQWAADHDHVVLTSDLDFGAILAATGRRRPSVIQLRSDNLSPSAIGDVVVSAIGQTRRELGAGAIVSVDASRARLRILPLGE